MSSSKRYFWLKLHENFFDQSVIKYLRKMPDGNTLVVIYLELLLMSIKTEGYIYYEGLFSTIEEELSLKLGEETSSIQYTLAALEKAKLMVRVADEMDLQMTELQDMVGIGSETASAKRSREYRKRKSLEIGGNDTVLLQCSTDAADVQQERHGEKDKEKDTESEKEIEKKSYGVNGNVLLSEHEYRQLQEKYPEEYETKINRLSRYILSANRKYEDHYQTILLWAERDEEKQKKQFQDYRFRKGESY